MVGIARLALIAAMLAAEAVTTGQGEEGVKTGTIAARTPATGFPSAA